MQQILTSKDIVLVGGGHAHVAVLKRFAMSPIPGVRMTLISPGVLTPYSGMLPGLIAGHYSANQAHIDVHRLCRFARARYFPDAAVGLDLAQRKVICARRPPVAFDLISLDIGSTPRSKDIPGAAKHAWPVKPVGQFLNRIDELAGVLCKNSGSHKIVIVGGGAGGVELALSMQHRLNEPKPPKASLHFSLVTASAVLLPTHNRQVQSKFSRILAERNVRVYHEHRVCEVDPGQVRCDNGVEIPFDTLLWVTEASAPPWLAQSGLSVDDSGFVQVHATLQSVSHPFVFAAGDIASVIEHPRPKSGVFAVRQGPPLTENLRRAAMQEPLRPFRPQKQFLSLITTGDQYAIASRGPFALEGRWVWRWKRQIDRRWMRQYQELPPMQPSSTHTAPPQPNTPLQAMRCGGCGAKIGAEILAQALQRIDPGRRADVLVDLSAPDDAALASLPAGHAGVHTVDYFRAFIDDPFRLGQIAANHALGDIYAMGAQPQLALAIVTLPVAPRDKLEEELFQLLAGAVEILRAHDTVLAGGHTAEGSELSIGFALHGSVDPGKVLRKGGLRAGDDLILTKPLGTGALLAADMRGQAQGQWIEDAIRSMLKSNRLGAACLSRHLATAATDVTGFGLLGHLLEMLRASGLGARLDLASIPVLDGAEQYWTSGLVSSLHPENVRHAETILPHNTFASDPRGPALFDPQTAGGLLAGVPASRSSQCVSELHDSGYHAAAIIGRVVAPGSPLVSVH